MQAGRGAAAASQHQGLLEASLHARLERSKRARCPSRAIQDQRPPFVKPVAGPSSALKLSPAGVFGPRDLVPFFPLASARAWHCGAP